MLYINKDKLTPLQLKCNGVMGGTGKFLLGLTNLIPLAFAYFNIYITLSCIFFAA